MRSLLRCAAVSALLSLIPVPSKLCAQTPDPYKIDLPTILPASPDASAFIKAGVGNANLSTGSASAAIPLYTISVRDYSLPVSLAYSTQGLKVSEANSRAGHGWTLDAGGVITRSVRGKPDEFAGRQAVPTNLTVDDTGSVLYSYLSNATDDQSSLDTQPDEFQFNVDGYSGKFVLDDNYHAKVTSTSNLVIDVSMGTSPGSTEGHIDFIYITAPDGIKYSFGSNFEKTTAISDLKFDPWKRVIKTSFFLDRIDLPTGEYILFTYATPSTFEVITGVTQALAFSTASGTECGGCTGYYTSPTTDRVSYSTRVLTNITTSAGQSVNFTYDTDYKKLTGLDIVGIKNYQFEYSTGDRFFLTRVKDVTLGTGTENEIAYSMSYYNTGDMPSLESTEQDYLGFYNSNSTGYLIPPTKTNGVMNFNFREPNFSKAKVGTLTKIDYPTGGSEEFIYEANTVKKISKRNTKDVFVAAVSGNSLESWPKTGPAVNFTSVRNETITVKFGAADVTTDGYTIPVTDIENKTVQVYMYDNTSNTTILNWLTASYYTEREMSVSLIANHSYTLQVKLWSYTEIGYLNFEYDTSPTDIYDTLNSIVPGVRLRQVKLTDPITGSTVNKFYTYGSLAHPTQSTGECLSPDFRSYAYKTTYCGAYDAYQTSCTLEMYSSNSTSLAYDNSGSGSFIYYPVVLESDDPNFINGGTEYTFYPNDNGAKISSLVGSIPFIPGGHSPTLAGKIKKKRVFNGSRAVIREEQTDYETRIDISGMPASTYVRKNFTPSSQMNFRLEAFEVSAIYYGNYWLREKTKTVKEYTNEIIRQTVSVYKYGTKENILPASITVTNSLGDSLRTELRYPNTYTPVLGTGYDILELKNIIAPVVAQSLYKNGTLQQQKKTIYTLWNGNQIQPLIIKLKKSPTDVLQDVIVYTDYNNSGNPTGLKKANDVPITYLWDEQYSLPVCEVKNAVPGQVAYTSFEASTFGNWTKSGTIYSTGGYTGSHKFSGNLTKAISIAGEYEVTLWTTDTNPTVNSATKVLLDTMSGGWKLYRWTLTNPTTITVTGTNIDEVRLKPVGAIMETYVHKPFVGILAKVDANNKLTTFSYDALGRLVAVRDERNNILKHHQYHYLTNPGN